jgi:hypothetical protein
VKTDVRPRIATPNRHSPLGVERGRVRCGDGRAREIGEPLPTAAGGEAVGIAKVTPHRFAVITFAVNTFAVNTFAVNTFAVNTFAVNTFAVNTGR